MKVKMKVKAKAIAGKKKQLQKAKQRKDLSVSEYVEGIRAGDRTLLSMGITLVEGSLPKQRQKAQELIEKIMPYTGNSLRLGISGIPGAGKSTFIETFGLRLIEQGHRVAVLAVDPSSSRTGGSILGDKTRMVNLSQNPQSFIRPSPTSGSLGGVTLKTREALFLCEAAHYDRILVETVGVGQSETIVAEMVDLFLVLLLPGAGDQLQGIKRGILELADLLIIHKADGDNRLKAIQAKVEFEGALRILRGSDPSWQSSLVACSSYTSEGMDEVDKFLRPYADNTGLEKTGTAELRKKILEKRISQRKKWMWDLIEGKLKDELKSQNMVKKILPRIESQVSEGQLTAVQGAESVLSKFYQSLKVIL